MLLSPAGQAQRLRKLAQQHGDRAEDTGDQIAEAAPTVAKPGEEQEPEPDLDADKQRIVDSGRLPSPQGRAQSPLNDSMTGGARADGSQASETDTDPVVTMSGGETLSALQVDLAAVIDDDIVFDLGRDVDPNDEASSFGGRSASNLSRALVGQTLRQVQILGRLRIKVREGDEQPDERDRCFNEWRCAGTCINFDLMADSQIHHLANATMSNAGYDDSTVGAGGRIDKMSLDDKRKWLWTTSFNEFVRSARATPLCDQPARSFRDLYLRNRAAGVLPGAAISMTLFAQQKDPSCVKIEELRWTIYVFCTGLEADDVLAMGRESLCGTYHHWLPHIHTQPALMLDER
jgi:hypothetical protein